MQAVVSSVRINKPIRENFESAARVLIEANCYQPKAPYRRQANVSAVRFAGRGNTKVDLRWHTKEEYSKLSKKQKDKLQR